MPILLQRKNDSVVKENLQYIEELRGSYERYRMKIEAHKAAVEKAKKEGKPIPEMPVTGMNRWKKLKKGETKGLKENYLELVTERFNQLNELNRETLASYIKKASPSYKKLVQDNGRFSKQALKRARGITRAATQILKKDMPHITFLPSKVHEKVEQVNELNRETLDSYIKKASLSLKDLAKNRGHFDKKTLRRSKGIRRAADLIYKKDKEEMQK